MVNYCCGRGDKPAIMALISAATAATERARASADQFCQAWVPPEEDRMMYTAVGHSLPP